jgi:hypothetical protein
MFVAVVSLALSRLLAMDTVLGISLGHDETRACIEGFLRSIEDGGTPLDGDRSAVQV